MSEPTTSGEAVTDVVPDSPAGPDDTRGLKRILKILITATVILIVVFGVIYYLGQKPSAAPVASIPDQAVVTLEQSLKEKPNDVGVRVALANAYARVGRTDEAGTQLKEVLRVQPDNRLALLSYAQIQYRQGDLKGAKENYQKIVAESGGEEFSAADPQLEEAFYYLGIVELGLNDAPGAEENLSRALLIDKSDADAWYQLGEAQTRLAKYDKAAQSYSTALAFVPVGWCDPYDGLSKAYGLAKKADGVTLAEALKQICTGDTGAADEKLTPLTTGEFQVPAMLGLASAAQSRGEDDKALGWYKKVLAIEPKNVTALGALATLQTTPSSVPSPESSASAS